jgi:hypothetical protein
MALALWACLAQAFERRPAIDLGFLAALAVFVMFKPNTIWIAAAFAWHYAVLRGARRTAIGAAFALVAAAGAWACGAAYFGNAAIWSEWLAYARGGSLVYGFQEGNQSWPMFLAQVAPYHGVLAYSILVTAAGALAAAVLLMRDGGPGTLMARGCGLSRDAWAMASLGVLCTLAASPLVWPYYHLFALVPIAWLLLGEGKWDGASWCAVATYVALSSPLLALLVAFEQFVALRLLMFLSWLPLVAAAGLRLARMREDAGQQGRPREQG